MRIEENRDKRILHIFRKQKHDLIDIKNSVIFSCVTSVHPLFPTDRPSCGWQCL